MPRCAGHDPLPLPARRILHPLHFSRERRETFRRGLAGSARAPLSSPRQALTLPVSRCLFSPGPNAASFLF